MQDATIAREKMRTKGRVSARLNGWRTLYGVVERQAIPRTPKPKPVGQKDDIPSEYEEQVLLCAWLDKHHILHYAIPNGGLRTYSEAAKFRRSGVKPGTPDLCIPIARCPHHGLYIELKRKKKGNVSEQQHYWIAALREQGYFAEVCRGAEVAKKVISDYLNLDLDKAA